MATTYSPRDHPVWLPRPPPNPGVGSLCAVLEEVAAGELLTPQWFFQRLIWNVVVRRPGSEASDIEGPLWL